MVSGFQARGKFIKHATQTKPTRGVYQAPRGVLMDKTRSRRGQVAGAFAFDAQSRPQASAPDDSASNSRFSPRLRVVSFPG
jgi:hypothetical protein